MSDPDVFVGAGLTRAKRGLVVMRCAFMAAAAVLAGMTFPLAAAATGAQTFDVEGHKLAVRKDGPTNHVVLLDGRLLLRDATDEFVSLLGPYVGQGRRYALVEENPGGNACEARYQAIDLAFRNIVVTPVFGDCAPVRSVSVEDGVLRVALGDRGDRYSFAMGVITRLGETGPHEAPVSAGLRVVAPNGIVRLYYRGPNTLGPTILSRNVTQIIAWPPTFVAVPDPTVRGLSLGMPLQDARSTATAIPLQPDETNAEDGPMVFYEGLGPRAPSVMGRPNVARLGCGPDVMSQIGLLNTVQRQIYQACLAVKPRGTALVVGAVTSVQQLDPASTAATALAALVGKYGPPSVQPAGNEMIWFAKDASGSTFAIDGLFTDFTTESRFTGPPGFSAHESGSAFAHKNEPSGCASVGG